MRILVATESKIKLNAVKRAIGEIKYEDTDKNVSVEVDGIITDSGVSKQPVSQEIMKGVENRMSFIKKNKNYDYYVSIENGITKFKTNSFDVAYVDVAYVLIEKKCENYTFKKTFAFSASVPIPQQFIDYVEKFKYTKTIGDAVKELYPDSDSKDPHFILCGIHREDLLKQAVEIAFNQFN
jgi:non-canonical (house-cleaning) NTP pyrophosphatase